MMIALKNLRLGYNNKEVIRIDGFKLSDNQDCLIIGESGCGKTTLLYAISGLVRPLNGKILVDNVDIVSFSEREMDKFRGKNIGIIFQNLHLVKSLNILDNLLLAFFLIDKKEDKDWTFEVLNFLGIKDLARKFPYELSHGQAQRVAIARAVLNRPQCILADEPTSGLDDKNCELVVGLLKEVARKTKSSLLISTHDSRLKKEFGNILDLGGGK
ncbi:MAG: ATP-binding cassette domain-containing protein [Rickettsiales bacterium]|nr:ATP-binding cassette domain-containing protein [Rickettsiales bacterium]